MAGKHAYTSRRWTKYPLNMHWYKIRNHWHHFSKINKALKNLKRRMTNR